MQRAEAGLFSYALEKRPAGTEEWSAVVSGSYESAGGPRQGGGSLTFDLDASAQLSRTPARGLVVVDYELAPGRAELALRLVGFSEEPGEAPKDAAFDYRRSPEGGLFEFGFPSEEGGWVEVRSRWRPDGAGRADGRVLGEETLLFSECWDERFVRTWHTWTQAPEEPADAPEGCVFGELELPEHVAAPEGG